MSVATPKRTISSGSSAASTVSVFGFANGSYCFFGIRTSRRPSRRSRRTGAGTGTSGSGSGSSCFVSGIFSAPPGAEQAMRRPRAVEVRLRRDLRVAELVLVARSDVDDACRARRFHQAGHRRPRLLRARKVELGAGLDEVDLRVDVPENRPAHAGGLPVSGGRGARARGAAAS
jgi:hypothetical protein